MKLLERDEERFRYLSDEPLAVIPEGTKLELSMKSTREMISERENKKAMTTFESLRIANDKRQIEWDPISQITPSFRALELGGEVGEALNVVKKLERERMGIKGSRDTEEHLAEELADVIICADLVASMYNIDLGKAVREKFNATSEKVGLNTRCE